MEKISKLGIPYKSRTPEYQRMWRKLNPEKEQYYNGKYKETHKNSTRKRRYGITNIQFNFLLEKQNYRCAICKNENCGPKQFHIDHCHITKKIRGLLCDKCNRGLGFFNDDVNLLKNAGEYLNENS